MIVCGFSIWREKCVGRYGVSVCRLPWTGCRRPGSTSWVFHSGSKALRSGTSGVWRRMGSRGAHIELESRCDLLPGLQRVTGHQYLSLPGPLPICEASQYRPLQSILSGTPPDLQIPLRAGSRPPPQLPILSLFRVLSWQGNLPVLCPEGLWLEDYLDIGTSAILRLFDGGGWLMFHSVLTFVLSVVCL